MNDKDDKRLRKTTIAFLKDFADKGYENAVECIDWLEKRDEQKLLIEKLPEEMKTIGESLGFTTQEECDNYNQMVTDLIMSDDDKNEQKPAWNEDDDKMLHTIIADFKGFIHNNTSTLESHFNECIDWLKSLKDRVQPQPKQKWSE